MGKDAGLTVRSCSESQAAGSLPGNKKWGRGKGHDRSIVGGKVSGIKRRQKMRPGDRTQQGVWLWHHVIPACSRGCWVLRFLKGPAWCLRAKTESVWAQLGATDTERVGRYGTARLQPARADMAASLFVFVRVRARACCTETGQWGNGLLTAPGGNLKCLGRRRG